MRIVIVAAGSWGDVRPNGLLGQALQDAGYQVVLIAAEQFREWVEGRGLTFAGLSVNIQAMLDAQTDGTLQMMRKVSQATVQMGKEIADVIHDGDAVLLNEGLLGLVNGALEKHRNRFIHINLQPWVPTREFSGMTPARPAWLPIPNGTYSRWMGSLVRRGQWWTMGRYGNQVRTHLGLPKQTWVKHRALLDNTPSLLLVSPHVLPRPVDWSAHHRVTGYVFGGESDWEAPQELRAFLAAGEKPVYIGFGSMPERNAEQTTRLFLDAVQRAGKRAVLLSGWAGIDASDLPNNVFLLKYAPHDWLFPRMSAVVHHGGAGTTAAALRAGIPSVIIPVMSDQPFWARRLFELGAATQPIPRPRLTVDNLASAITEASTSDAMHRQAAELSVKIRAEDGLGAAVRVIHEYLNQITPYA
jgi:sterol 3beta-glucosyltransferase